MMVGFVVVASLTLQLIAVYFALHLIRRTGKRLAWSLIAVAIALMALRSAIHLGQMFMPGGAPAPVLSRELVTLAISALMALGIQRLTPIFASLSSAAARQRESELRYRTMFEHSPVSIWEEDFSEVKGLFDRLRAQGVSDVEAYFEQHPDAVKQCADLTRIIDVNRAALLLHEADSRETLLAGLANTFTPESFATFRQELVCLWRGETEMSREAVVQTLDGKPRNVVVYIAVCPGYEETLSKVFVSLIDITARVRAEQELKTSEQGYHMLVNSIPACIARFDSACRYLFVNAAAERTFGVTRERLLGKSLSEAGGVGSDEQVHMLEHSMRQAFASGSVTTIEVELETRQGPRMFDIVQVPERDEQGKVATVLSIAHDISERKQADLERQVHTEFLANMDRVNRAIQGADDLESMMTSALDAVLEVFGCDRASLVYPCDPDGESWTARMERNLPDYPGSLELGEVVPIDAETERVFRTLLDTHGPVRFGPGSPHPLPKKVAEHFNIRSQLALALYPKDDKPWMFVIHQCSFPRIWIDSETLLMQEIGRRLSDGLGYLSAHRKLQESEAKYRRIIDTASEGMLGLDERFDVTFVNTRMAEILGCRREEMLGRPVTEFLFEEDLADHEERMHSRKTGVAETYERRMRRKDGEAIWVLICVDPIVADDGTFQGAFAMVTDIAERKRAELQLKRAAEFTEGVINAIPDILLELNSQGEYLNIWTRNPRMLAAPKEKLIGKTVHEVISAEAAAVVMEALREAGENGLSFGKLLRIELPHGTHWFELSVSKKPSDDPSAETRFIMLSRDVTERVSMDEALRAHKERLEEIVQQRTEELRLARDAAEAANKAKSVFLANMSHELRTPLNAILGFSHLMRQEPGLTEEHYQNLDIINQSGEHLLKLINDVLEIAKIEAGKLQLDHDTFDLRGMVSDVVDMMRLRAQVKGLYVELEQSSDCPRYAKGDEARLRQILVNLVGNAIKFTTQGGVVIRVGTKGNAQQHLLIEVEDSGPGISAQDREHLFRPFTQLPAGVVHGGTGLGLSIVWQFVQLMGGLIAVDAAPGGGALFRVDVPLETADSTEIARLGGEGHDEVPRLAPGQPAYRILVAENQRDNQMLLARLMRDLGMEVKTANNGEECIRVFEQWRPDLIWMDWRMPVMDGAEAARRIRRLSGGEKVKIVAVTASAFEEQVAEVRAAGMDDYVRKPYRFGEICASMERQLGVEFVYPSGMQAPREPEPEPLTAQRLAGLAEEQRAELRSALESLDRRRIDTAIERIEADDAGLARTLRALAGAFDYPDILSALDAVVEITAASPEQQGGSP